MNGAIGASEVSIEKKTPEVIKTVNKLGTEISKLGQKIEDLKQRLQEVICLEGIPGEWSAKEGLEIPIEPETGNSPLGTRIKEERNKIIGLQSEIQGIVNNLEI